jgi:hypothetical protein
MAQGPETHEVPDLAATIRDEQEQTEETEQDEQANDKKCLSFHSLCCLCYLRLNLEPDGYWAKRGFVHGCLPQHPFSLVDAVAGRNRS